GLPEQSGYPVRAGGRLVLVELDADLLRPDPHLDHGVDVGGNSRRRHVDLLSGGETDRRDVPLAAGELTVQQVRGAEEPGDELGGGRFVNLLRGADLLDLAVTHDSEAVRHG